MKYMGSKAKVARYIVPIIQEQIERSGYETYLEPFCGGCNVIDKVEIFDHADFWRVARLWSHDNIVLISEQEAPDDFVPVWIHSVTRTMNQNKTIAATEKLFVAKEVLEREEIVAAV